MTAVLLTVPANVQRFEVLLYSSLLLDTLSTAMQASNANAGDPSYGAVNFANAMFILGFTFLVGLASRQRKNWARRVLLVALMLATMSLLATLHSEGLSFTSTIDILSVGLTAAGLYASFTGDARGWFTG